MTENNLQAERPDKATKTDQIQIAQNTSIADLVGIMKEQNREIARLRQQNERIVELLENVSDEDPDLGLFYVKVEDINMPFRSLVGFLVKVSLASIPAMIILAALYVIAGFILGLLGIGIGSFLGG